MWEALNIVITFLIQEGGIFGLLVAVAIIWIGFREWSLIKKKKADPETLIKAEEAAVIKEKQESQIEAFKMQTIKLDEVEAKVQEIASQLENFVGINNSNNEKIEKLTEQLQQVNDERVEELKEILGSYNKTMNELALTLQKIKFVLKTKLGED